MQLLTKAIEAKLPELYSTEETPLEDKILAVKYFTPFSNWTWYGVEFDPKSRIFFGFVVGFEKEWGEFSLTELEEMGGKIERDLYWEPITYGEAHRKGKL